MGFVKFVNNDTTSPAYYRSGGMECIDAIRCSMEPSEFRGFLKGNVMKYLWRYDNKGGVSDLMKAKTYLNYLIESLQQEED